MIVIVETKNATRYLILLEIKIFIFSYHVGMLAYSICFIVYKSEC